MPRIRPENTETRPGNMRKMPSTARTWQKPGRKATALPPGKGPVLLKSGQIQPGSGRKVMPTRTELQMQDLLKPGQRLLGPGRKVQQNRMGFPEPSPPRPGQKHLPRAAEASASAKAADTSAKASASSATAAKASQEEAATQATMARQSAESAAEKLAQMQINLKVKANVDSPVLTGTPAAPTPAANAQSTQIANVAYVKQKIAELVNGSDASLDTLKELADALGNVT